MIPMETMLLGLRLAKFEPPPLLVEPPPRRIRRRRRVRKCCLWSGRIFRRIFWFNVFLGLAWTLAHLSEYATYTYAGGAGRPPDTSIEEHLINVYVWWVILILLPVIFVYFTTNRRDWE